jgi:hypothetical protein
MTIFTANLINCPVNYRFTRDTIHNSSPPCRDSASDSSSDSWQGNLNLWSSCFIMWLHQPPHIKKQHTMLAHLLSDCRRTLIHVHMTSRIARQYTRTADQTHFQNLQKPNANKIPDIVLAWLVFILSQQLGSDAKLINRRSSHISIHTLKTC